MLSFSSLSLTGKKSSKLNIVFENAIKEKAQESIIKKIKDKFTSRQFLFGEAKTNINKIEDTSSFKKIFQKPSDVVLFVSVRDNENAQSDHDDEAKKFMVALKLVDYKTNKELLMSKGLVMQESFEAGIENVIDNMFLKSSQFNSNAQGEQKQNLDHQLSAANSSSSVSSITGSTIVNNDQNKNMVQKYEIDIEGFKNLEAERNFVKTIEPEKAYFGQLKTSKVNSFKVTYSFYSLKGIEEIIVTLRRIIEKNEEVASFEVAQKDKNLIFLKIVNK